MRLRPASLLFALFALPATFAYGSGLPLPEGTGQTGDFFISGMWPDSCEPAIRNVRHDAAGGLDVVLESGVGACAPLPHPFRVALPVADGFSPARPADDVVPVRVYAHRDQVGTELLGFTLRGGKTKNLAPDSGFWWPQGENAASGNVLSLELQGRTVGIALLAHDDLSGQPVWFFGTSSLTGRTVHARLSRLDNGSSPFFGIAVQPVPHPGWTIDIAFESGTRARVWLSRPSPVQDGSLELAELGFARRSFQEQAQGERWLGSWLVARDLAPGQDNTAGSIPRRLDFASSQQLDRRHTRLIDAGGDFALDCTHGIQHTDTAQGCVLRDAAGNLLARFDEVGLQRLDGQDAQGRDIVLLRGP